MIAGLMPGQNVLSFAPPDWRAEPRVHGNGAAAPPSPLTPREREVLELAAGGLNGPAIAEHLVLTQETVRTHFANIYRKLDVGERAAAVAKAIRLGLIE
jgi:two-component system nitrate/nitrite response regulator NarL